MFVWYFEFLYKHEVCLCLPGHAMSKARGVLSLHAFLWHISRVTLQIRTYLLQMSIYLTCNNTYWPESQGFLWATSRHWLVPVSAIHFWKGDAEATQWAQCKHRGPLREDNVTVSNSKFSHNFVLLPELFGQKRKINASLRRRVKKMRFYLQSLINTRLQK